MTGRRRSTRRATVLMMLILAATSVVAQESRAYKGLPLADVLREMQQLGLRVVFSSAVVPPDLRVATEPHATTPRQQLDELLAPHGLEIRRGPGGTLQVVRARRAPLPSRSSAAANGEVVVDEVAVRAVPGEVPPPARHIEYVSVTDSLPTRSDRGVASEMSLDRSDMEQLHGSLAEDPIRAVQALPHVTAVDDFRTDFTMRGSPFRHVGLVIDGVSTQWLQHTAPGRGATGSLSMLSGLVLEGATLRTGAYPRRHSDRLGPELELALRDGARTDVRVRGAIGGTHAMLIGEGPIGRVEANGAACGSWLLAARQSYLEWPPQRSESSRTAFGFSDAVAKAMFDLHPTQQVSFTALTGVSSSDTEDDVAATEWDDGIHRASVFNLSLRSTFATALVVSQRAYVVTQRFRDVDRGEHERAEGENRAVGYRADLTRALAGGLLEAGAQLERAVAAHASAVGQPTFIGSSSMRSAFAHYVWAPFPALTLSPGLRVTSSTLVRTPAVSRWLLGEWSFRPGWSVIGSTGVSRQLPELGHVLGLVSMRELQSERAAHLELGVEQRLTSAVRWQANMFTRKEADILRAPTTNPRLEGGVLVFHESERYANALHGTSRGIELLVERRSPRGLVGWVAYSYGRMRHTDMTRAETYWADFDQRHATNVSATYRFSSRASVGATFRAGSGFPIPEYLANRHGRLFVSDSRNEVRLPPFARLDLRADRTFQYLGRRLTVFVEALNALNRANVGRASGSIDPLTGEATGFTDTLLRRRASAGIVIEF